MIRVPFSLSEHHCLSFEQRQGAVSKTLVIILSTSTTILFWTPLASITEGYLCLKHVTK